MNEDINKVTLIGYEGEKTIPEVRNKKDIIIENRIYIGNTDKSKIFNILKKIPILHAIVKGIMLLMKLLFILLSISRYEVIIIQNPPCIPVFFAAWLISLVNSSHILIDWHNLGYSMFEDKLGSKHILVKISYIIEKIIGYLAHSHICVSKAMSIWLLDHFNINTTVLYDRPANMFSSDGPQLKERHRLLSQLNMTDENYFPELYHDNMNNKSNICETVQTYVDGETGKICLRDDFAPILLSSTSWTADEDFNLLLNSLVSLDQHLCNIHENNNINNKMPFRILTVITGKGPMKKEFEDKVSNYRKQGKLTRIAICTPWLEPSDYPIMMSCVELGVCLHTSTSGLDLPMKVIDMFGSGVPVVAVSFPTLPELIKHKENGLIFQTSDELFILITNLLFPKIKHQFSISNSINYEIPTLKYLKNGVLQFEKWDDNWNKNLRQHIKNCINKTNHKRLLRRYYLLSFILLILMFLYKYFYV
jgi:beta-1,4-mannosyltransferase